MDPQGFIGGEPRREREECDKKVCLRKKRDVGKRKNYNHHQHLDININNAKKGNQGKNQTMKRKMSFSFVPIPPSPTNEFCLVLLLPMLCTRYLPTYTQDKTRQDSKELKTQQGMLERLLSWDCLPASIIALAFLTYSTTSIHPLSSLSSHSSCFGFVPMHRPLSEERESSVSNYAAPRGLLLFEVSRKYSRATV